MKDLKVFIFSNPLTTSAVDRAAYQREDEEMEKEVRMKKEFSDM